MRYMVVNIDKQQYFRPVELGGSHGSAYNSVTEWQTPYDAPWMAFLAHLIESRPEGKDPSSWRTPWNGTWAGDRVTIVRGDDDSGRFLPEDIQALQALGAEIKDYKFLRDSFTDLTKDLQAVWPKIDRNNSWYERITEPPDFRWLTTKLARKRLYLARTQGDAFYRGYLNWVRGLEGLRPSVRALVTGELRRLNQQATLQGSGAGKAPQ